MSASLKSQESSSSGDLEEYGAANVALVGLYRRMLSLLGYDFDKTS